MRVVKETEKASQSRKTEKKGYDKRLDRIPDVNDESRDKGKEIIRIKGLMGRTVYDA